MRKRYMVGLEEAVWRFRWPWQARRHFRAVKQYKQGEAVILAKQQRNGGLKILAERTAPDAH
jgi:hypothetical protein